MTIQNTTTTKLQRLVSKRNEPGRRRTASSAAGGTWTTRTGVADGIADESGRSESWKITGLIKRWLIRWSQSRRFILSRDIFMA